MIDNWITTEKEELHKVIRKKRNNVTQFIVEHKEELRMVDVFKLTEYKNWLDTIDYLLDKGE